MRKLERFRSMHRRAFPKDSAMSLVHDRSAACSVCCWHIGPRTCRSGGEARGQQAACFGSMSAPTRKRPRPGSTSSNSTLPADASRNPRSSRKRRILRSLPCTPGSRCFMPSAKFPSSEAKRAALSAPIGFSRKPGSSICSINNPPEVRDLATSVSIVAGRWCWWPTTAAAPWPVCPSGRTEA